MTVFVCGSLAFDTTMVLDGKLRIHQDRHHAINYDASDPRLETDFLVPDLRRNYGGSAGNISYNLKLIGVDAVPVSTVGMDFLGYDTWLDKSGINKTHIKVMEHSYTAHTYTTLDTEDNRITAFHPGAMSFSHYNRMQLHDGGVEMGVIAADAEDGIRIHADQFSEGNIPFMYYPSHSMKTMLEDDWLHLIEQSRWTVLNSEQCEYMEKHTGLTAEQISKRVNALIINQGNDGARIYRDGLCHIIPGTEPKVSYDLSGCDDAFCAGLTYGILHDIDWDTAGRVAVLMSAIKAEHYGTQQHSFTQEQFKQRFQDAFAYELLN